jgi:hypothetical protein
MRNDANYWREFGRFFGIEVLAPVRIELAGVQAHFTALLPQFGALNGMIVDANWEAIAPHKSALLEAGYGFSCTGGGDPDRFSNPDESDSAREMLSDWGWTSAASEPDWLRS